MFVVGEALFCCILMMVGIKYWHSNHQDNKKKAPTSTVKVPEGKRIRRERGELEEIVFKLFERRPNWALKQLVEGTNQHVVSPLFEHSLTIHWSCSVVFEVPNFLYQVPSLYVCSVL